MDTNYILVIVDEYSKFVTDSICKKQNGPTLKNVLMKCFALLGFPKILRSDNGPTLIAKTVTSYLALIGVEQQFSFPHNHKSNAFVERFNRTLRGDIRINRGKPLMDIVTHFVYAYNRSKSIATGLSPAQLLLNTADRLLEDSAINNKYSCIHELMKDTYSRFNDESSINRKQRCLQVGDFVLRKVMHRKDKNISHKNQETWEGSFTITKHLFGDTYELERVTKGRRTRSSIEKVHTDRLKLYVHTKTKRLFSVLKNHISSTVHFLSYEKKYI